MASLTYASTTLALPDAVLWSDEYDWQPVEERRTYSITGALLIDVGLRLTGRPITLRGWWLSRAQIDQLQAWAALPAAFLTLVLRGVTYTVRFDHVAPPVEAASLFALQDPDAATLYSVTARFIETS